MSTPDCPPLGPLVEPGPELTADEIARYQRHLGLGEVGTEGQRRLKNARVLVVGAGGLGSPALHYLAAAGVGTLGMLDDDIVDLSNLQRQIVHATPDLGRPKVASAADRVLALNPLLTVVRHDLRLTADNVVDLIAGYDLVLDGTDNFATRYLVSDAAEILRKPVVWGAILRFHGQLAVFWAGRGPTYRDLFPEPPDPASVPSCAEAGVLGVLPGVIGTLMATEAIKLILGRGEPLLGRLLVYDSLGAQMRSMRILPDPTREPVTEVRPVEVACAVGGPTTAETLDVPALKALLARRDSGELSVAVVDVREDSERALGIVPGAFAAPLADIQVRGIEALPAEARGRDVVLYCAAGVRSSRALETLRPAFAGLEVTLRHLDGGYAAWSAAK
ncbi:MAG: molybdopterin-synthase adenylyltransferase MoeB [Propionibacteriaceae bacterium]|nr:molybdopterin-synthase adenylyltransferase MoeB [Propionibacteriaceae bacterium]